MACVTSASYSICVNDDLHGYFRGKRGLRQGDLLSSYLFTLVMEVLTLMLKRNISLATGFRYHPRCDRLKIINLCFADDLFIFSYGNVDSVEVIRKSLEEFKRCSGLSASLPKSTAFFSNVRPQVKNAILSMILFKEGSLPVRYLGMPLVSSRLVYRDCKILVDRIWNKISEWKNKIIKDIEQLMRGFLWCQGDLKKGKVKVRWDDVGNGCNVSAWYDSWRNIRPLINSITEQDIVQAGFNKKVTVRDVFGPTAAAGTQGWIHTLPTLQSLVMPMLNSNEDQLLWKGLDGNEHHCSVALTWNSIRPRAADVPWFRVVWFSQCVPKHEFILWLLMGERLKMKDKLKPWDHRAHLVLKCWFCDDNMESCRDPS
ncbi:uncharacterized protein [Rutidosis leptorrhynchoides]|uniref:uncharacterized protein n=1 Tax=Rutidosis leptorrhynchoides TaxID=125765 RepID=UPI003A99D99D